MIMSQDFESDLELSETSTSSEDCTSVESEVLPRKKRVYRRAIHHGFKDKRARYHRHTGQLFEYLNTQTIDDQSEIGAIDNSDLIENSSNLGISSDSDSSISDTDTFSDSSNSSVTGSSIFEESEGNGTDVDRHSTPDTDILNVQKPNYRKDKLFPDCPHTIYSSHVVTMLFVIKHNLSKEAFSDLLMLLNSHLPKPYSFTTSIYKFKETLKQCIGNFTEPLIHKYCEICQDLLMDGTPCQRDLCRTKRAKILEFYDLNLEYQLKEFFQDDKFCQLVSRELQTENELLTDITDGSKYKEIIQGEAERPAADVQLTFTLNTDGVSIFSSSKKGNLWPVYLAVNELPVKLRFSRKYLLPCYLHCQTEKPNMLTYLSPMMQMLKNLYSTGIEVTSSDGAKFRVTGQLLTASVDLIARAEVANMKLFNGKSGCIICNDEGECPPGSFLHRYYPFTENNTMRTHQGMLQDAREACQIGKPVKGIKGASPLIVLKYIDLPQFFAIDWMHCVLLGVVKNLLSFWFDSKHKDQNYFIGGKIALMNERLLQIKIPDFVARRPRSLADHSHWKASECREWLMHFSVPVLYGVLNPEAFVHYTLLVTAMGILTNDTISPNDIDYAEELLLNFCRLFPSVYSITSQTMNVHLLRHLSHFVRMYGPLFSHSCFGFESMNSYMKKMVHGTGHVNSQISFAVGMTKRLGNLVKELTEDSIDPDIKKTALCLGSRFMIEDAQTNTVALGRKSKLQDTDAEWHLLPTIGQLTTAYKFKRLRKAEEVYYCEEQQQTKTRNSFTVALDSGNNAKEFGCVTAFIEADKKLYAVVNMYETSSFSLPQETRQTLTNPILKDYIDKELCQHIFQISRRDLRKKLVPVNALGKKCVLIRVLGASFISLPPNVLEHG